MKISKKIVTAIVALTMCASSAAALSSCAAKHTHEYGDWQITLPTEFKTGKAVKVCATDEEHDHDISVVLPALTDSSYTVKQDSTTKLKTYTYAHEDGDIVFTTYSATSVKEAVEMALFKKSEVVSGSAKASSTTIYSGDDEDRGDAVSNVDVSYEYGDNYIHIVDGEMNNEKWYTKNSDGSVFAVYSFYDRNGDKQIGQAEFADIEESFGGYGFGYVYWMGETKMYGLENFVSYLYNEGTKNVNGDFVESFSSTGYSFSYAVPYTYTTNPDEEGLGLHTVSVEFTLDDKYTLSSAEVNFYTYVNTQYVPDDNMHYSLGILEKNGNAVSVVDGKKDDWKTAHSYKVTQTSSGTKATNPYKHENMFATDFKIEQVTVNTALDVTGDLGEVEDGATINMTATTPVVLQLQDVDPETANFYFDEVKLYNCVTNAEGKEEYVELIANYDGGDDGNIKASFDCVNKLVTVNCYVAGDFKFVIKSANVEKVLNLHVPYSAPTGFASSVYVYNEASDKGIWNNVTTDYEVYEGQSLNFTSTVDHPSYQESGFTATVKDANGDDVTNDVLTNSKVDGVDVKKFVASEAGEYTVTLTSNYNTTNPVSVTLNVTVNNTPSYANLLDGLYENETEEVSVTFDFVAKTVQIVVGSEDSAVTTNMSFDYDATKREVTATYVSGANDNAYEFELTESYNLFLKYTDDKGISHRLFLLKDGSIVDTVSGTYPINVGSVTAAEEIYVSANGFYELTSTAYTKFLFYRVDVDGKEGNMVQVEKATLIPLLEGSVVRVWTVMSPDSDTFTFRYDSPLTSVESVSIDKTTANMTVGGDKLTLVVTVTPEDATIKTLTWTTSNSAVATVDENGVVTAVGAGTATITGVTHNGLVVSCNVTVTFVNVSEVSLDKSEANLVVGGDSLVLKATISPDNASNTNGTWTSSDEEVATVSASGVVKAVGEGTATITFTTEDGAKTASCEVTVTVIHVTGVEIEEAVEIYMGDTVTLHATFTPANASDKTGTWTSSDEKVATVDSKGVVTGVSAGTVTITFTSTDNEEATASCEVTVKERPLKAGDNEVYIEKWYTRYLYTFKGEADTKYAVYIKDYDSGYYLYGAKEDGTYDSSTEIYSDVLAFTTNEDGEAIIYIYITTKETTIVVNVGEPVKVESVTLDKATAEYYVGDTINLVPSFNPENATEKTGTWSSSDTSVVNIENQYGINYVKAVGTGTATVTFTTDDGGKTASCEVTVKERTLSVGDNNLTNLAITYMSVTYTLNGEPNTKYVVAIKEGSGSIDYVQQKTVTTNSEGKVNINVLNYTADMVISVEKFVEPEEPAMPEITLPVNGTTGFSNLTHETTALKLSGFEAGKTYKVYTTADGWAKLTTVEFSTDNENWTGTELTFGYTATTNLYVRAIAENGTAMCQFKVEVVETQPSDPSVNLSVSGTTSPMTLNHTGVTFNLTGFEPGKTYEIYAYDDFDPLTTVEFSINGQEWENVLTLTYGVGVRTIYARAVAEDGSVVCFISVYECEDTTPPAPPSGTESVVLDQNFTVTTNNEYSYGAYLTVITFTPETTGNYMVTLSDKYMQFCMSRDDWDDGTFLIDPNYNDVYSGKVNLTEGTEYNFIVACADPGDYNLKIAYVEVKTVLNKDFTVTEDNESSYGAYLTVITFTPETTGNYMVTLSDTYMQFCMSRDDWDDGTFLIDPSDNGVYSGVVNLTAGTEYNFIVACADPGKYNIQISETNAEADTGSEVVQLQLGTTNVGVAIPNGEEGLNAEIEVEESGSYKLQISPMGGAGAVPDTIYIMINGYNRAVATSSNNYTVTITLNEGVNEINFGIDWDNDIVVSLYVGAIE